MKIRKALEKAKNARGEDKPVISDTTITGRDAETTTGKSGWISPKYSESKSIKLDLQKVCDNRCVCMLQDAPEIENYKVLRTQIQQRTKADGLNTIMVTSVHAGEGKTVTSINLAITFAKEFNQTVLLVDNDLRQQNIHRYLGISSKGGVIDYLKNGTPLTELIIWPGIEKLTFISGGRAVYDTTELLVSPRMKDLVAEMKTRYDDRYIIFDVPPILGVSDAIAFAPLVDSIIMVVEYGRTLVKDVEKALELIPKEKFLGFVLNKQKNPVILKNRGYEV